MSPPAAAAAKEKRKTRPQKSSDEANRLKRAFNRISRKEKTKNNSRHDKKLAQETNTPNRKWRFEHIRSETHLTRRSLVKG